jgi:hypothetical protein
VVDIEWAATDVPAFEPSPSHSRPHSLDNQRSFQLGDGRDDHDDGAAQRAAGIKLLPEADVLDVQPVQFIQHFQEVTHTPGQAIASPDQDNIEAAAAGIGQHPVQPGPPGPGAANAVIDILLHDLKPALLGYLLKIVKL